MSNFDTLIQDLVIADRILASEEVVDTYGHVSVRHPDNPNRFLIARSLAPELVGPEDIVELDLDGQPVRVNKGTRRPMKLRARAGAEVQGPLDQGKETVKDLASQASEAGAQAADRAGELLQKVAPQAKEAASNLYERGSQSGEYVRQYAAKQPGASLLIAAAIGYGLAYLIHRR